MSYRAVTIVPEKTLRGLWGADVFIWHIPTLKVLAAVGVIGWFW